MPWVKAIIELLNNFFASLPLLDKWFSKSATQKADEAKLDERAKADHFRKTGRPKW